MLYNKNWDAKTVTSDPTLESLIAWLEKQPASKEYDWANCDGECLIGQYGTAHGISWERMNEDDDCFSNPYTRLTGETGIAYTRPHTFGAALDRARAELAAR